MWRSGKTGDGEDNSSPSLLHTVIKLHLLFSCRNDTLCFQTALNLCVLWLSGVHFNNVALHIWIFQVSHILVTPHSRFCSTVQLSSRITAARHLMGKTSAETPPPIIDLCPLPFPLSVRDSDKNLGGWCMLNGEDCEGRAEWRGLPC